MTSWQPLDEALVRQALSTVAVRDQNGELYPDAERRQTTAVLTALAEHGRLCGGEARPWHLEYYDPVGEEWVELSAHPTREAADAHTAVLDVLYRGGTRLRLLDPNGQPAAHHGPAGAPA